jgi:ABC-type nitrate/sulfonate/bicarbonate transport system permease component
MRDIGGSRASGFLLIVLLLLLWEKSSRMGWVDANYLPPVTIILQSLFDLVHSLEIIRHTLITLKRVILGYLLGVSVGYLLGFLCGYLPKAYSFLELTVECLRPMPSIALIPIGILFLGMGDALNVAIIGWACSWPVFINTMDGVRSTDHVLLNTARTFGSSRWRIIRKVIMPASLPFVFTGLRISLGIAVAVVIITEMVASGTGLGFFIISTSISYRVPQMYAGIITIGVFGYLLNQAFLMIDRKVLGWEKGLLSAGK